MLKRAAATAAFVAVLLARGAAFGVPTASIDFVQGATNPPAGQAIAAVTGSSVTVANASNTAVASWQVDLYDVPPNSALATGTIASSNSGSTPTASFTPDVAGTYRVALKVWNLVNRVGTATDLDIRDVIIGLPNTGLWVPPLQTWPRPLPPLASAYVGAKASESNLSGCDRGWDGCGADGGLRNLIILVDARLPSAAEKAVLDAGTTAGTNMYDAADVKSQAALWNARLPVDGGTISDADTTINVSGGSRYTMPTTTANRVVTFGVSGSPVSGAEVMRVDVTRTSAFTVTFKDDASTTLVVCPASTRCSVVVKHDGTHFANPSLMRIQ